MCGPIQINERSEDQGSPRDTEVADTSNCMKIEAIDAVESEEENVGRNVFISELIDELGEPLEFGLT